MKGPAVAAYGYALLVAVALGYFLLRIPIQLTDSFANMLALDKPLSAFLWGAADDGAYLRPGLWAELKVVYDLAAGNYFLWFRLTQVAQLAAVLFLFVRLMRPQTAAAAAAVPLGLGVLIGHHAFAGTVREAFPINTFLTILVCCAVAANLSFARHRWWVDAAAVALFVLAAATVESGLLVWVICAAGYLVGLRGVSRAGLAAMTVCLVAYFVARAAAGVTAPGLIAREAGYGFTRYSGQELEAMFGASPYGFYAYNVAASVLGLFFAEPRDGIWRFVGAMAVGERDWPALINVVSSTLSTALLAWYVWMRRHAWLARTFDRRDCLIVLFAGVLAANAAMCYAYTKDVIMSPAAFFYAAATAAAATALIERLPLPPRRAAVALVVLAALSITWSVRVVGIHAALAESALTVREEWAYFDDWAAKRGAELDAHGRMLKDQLEHDAIVRFPAPPPLRDPWLVLFDRQ